MNEYVKNDYNCTIVKCCASCANQNPISDKQRLCLSGEGNVSPHYLCPMWKMRESLKNAGKGDGRIKKKSYLMRVINTISDEQAAYERLPKNMRSQFPWTSITEIRSNFEKEQGTVYLNF